MSENDLRRDLRARSVKLFSYPVDFLMRWRSVVKFLLHGAIFVFSYIGAYLLRFEFSLSPEYWEIIRQTIPLVLVSKAAAFLAFGLFHGWWRYVSLRDVLGRKRRGSDRHVLVVGAGTAGSIGSELCRQIARRSPGRLILFEIAESPHCRA